MAFLEGKPHSDSLHLELRLSPCAVPADGSLFEIVGYLTWWAGYQPY